MTKEEHWLQYARWLTRQERLFAPKVFRALKTQVDNFLAKVKDYDITGARQEAESTVINEALLNVLGEMQKKAGVARARVVYSTMRKAIRKEYTGIGFNEKWTAEIVKYFRENNLLLVSYITGHTREKLLEMLEAGISEGLSIEQIVNQIEQQLIPITRNRAYVISRTELNSGANAGTVIGARDLDFETQKEWLTSRDHRVRGWSPKHPFSHIQLNGDRVELDGKFNNGEYLDFPGDPKASAANRINCRCTCLIRPKRDNRGKLIPRVQGINIPRIQTVPG